MKLFGKLLLLACSCISVYSYGQASDTAQQTLINTSDNMEECSDGCCCGGPNPTPLGIMTDHIHPKGKWMVSYTYMNTAMQGNRMGTTKASDNMVYQNYTMAPETMTMQMHMGMVMYGVTDRLTLMAMGGYVVNNMSMNMASTMMTMPGMTMANMNMTMQSSSAGLSDTKVYGLYNLSNSTSKRIIASLGVNIPTGSIRETGTTMLGDNQRLAYDMQPGTGFYSLLPGITYIQQYSKFSFGADAGADIKLDNNSLGYKWGNVYHATAWAAYQFLPFISASVRAEAIDAGKLTGSDPQVAIAIYEQNDPTTSTANYGGKWVSGYVGLNFHVNKPVLNNFRLLTEYGLPVYQNLNGTQIALHGNFYAGLQYSF